MSTEVITTCITCVPPGSLCATLIVVGIGVVIAVHHERRRLGTTTPCYALRMSEPHSTDLPAGTSKRDHFA
jgi:hypothetical protein